MYIDRERERLMRHAARTLILQFAACCADVVSTNLQHVTQSFDASVRYLEVFSKLLPVDSWYFALRLAPDG